VTVWGPPVTAPGVPVVVRLQGTGDIDGRSDRTLNAAAVSEPSQSWLSIRCASVPALFLSGCPLGGSRRVGPGRGRGQDLACVA
jgi:hypothetical protein